MYYAEIEVDNAHIGVEVDANGDADAYYLMSDGELSDRHWICAMDHLKNEGIQFNGERR